MSSFLDITEGDLLALLADGTLEDDVSEDDNSALQSLSRRISGQYVDVLATFASQSLAGKASPGVRTQVGSAADALRRLAEASGDPELQAAMDQVPVLLELHESRVKGARKQLVKKMREWVLVVANLLEADDAQRLRDLVSFDRRAIPLLDQLSGLRGIGPRRLESLYHAGLFTVEALCDAEALEVSQATGLPLNLANDVIEASKQFAVEQRRSAAAELGRRATEVREALALLRKSGSSDPELARVVRRALAELSATMSMLGAETAPEPVPPTTTAKGA